MDPPEEEVHGRVYLFPRRQRENNPAIADFFDVGEKKSRQTILVSGNEFKFTAVANFQRPSVGSTQTGRGMETLSGRSFFSPGSCLGAAEELSAFSGTRATFRISSMFLAKT